MTFEADPIAILARDELHVRLPGLIAEACAWSVGMSDRPHYRRLHGRVSATGVTLGARAAGGALLSGEEDLPLELGEVRAGTFRDALGALTADGRLYAEVLDQQVLGARGPAAARCRGGGAAAVAGPCCRGPHARRRAPGCRRR